MSEKYNEQILDDELRKHCDDRNPLEDLRNFNEREFPDDLSKNPEVIRLMDLLANLLMSASTDKSLTWNPKLNLEPSYDAMRIFCNQHEIGPIDQRGNKYEEMAKLAIRILENKEFWSQLPENNKSQIPITSDLKSHLTASAELVIGMFTAARITRERARKALVTELRRLADEIEGRFEEKKG
jgi:hypothetical protein